MAKEDFCFTYYDGDAARDKAHMNRLCRGAYDDFISMQRKAGHLDLETIKMILGNDFDACWVALKFILKIDEAGKFFIEWVDQSIEKMRKNSEKQKQRIDDYWAKKREENDTTEIPRNNHGNTNVYTGDIPLEDGNGNENGDVFKEINIDFEIFWDLYDKKVRDKGKLKKKWISLKDSDREKAIEHIPKYIEAQPDKKYRKDPATYLNNKSFNDEIITNASNQAHRPSTKQGTSDARTNAVCKW